MLTHLHIAHFVLIEQLDIDLHHGFSVITGETGAGKSIILGALSLLTGAKAEQRMVKEGCKKCVVEGVFDIETPGLETFFTEHDIDYDPDEHLCIIRREVTAAGKSRAFVNDTPVLLTDLKTLCAHLIDIHSQHQNLLMGQAHFLLDTLDAVGEGASIMPAYRQAYQTWRDAKAWLDDLRQQQQEDADQADFLTMRCREIDDAHLQEDEQATLEEEADMLAHAGDIKEGLYSAMSAFDENGADVAGHLRQATAALERISRVFAPAAELRDRIDSARIEIEDIADETERLASRVDFDPQRQMVVDDRLRMIYELEKKHHVETIAEILDIRNDMAERLDRLACGDEALAEAVARVEQAEKFLYKEAGRLSEARQKAATEMANHLTQTLAFLGMPHGRVSFALEKMPTPGPMGADMATLLFSGNAQLTPQDVSQIASGGETARLMLALKAFVAQRKTLPTIIFDEIDTGVSGKAAEKMARVMQQMADHCQVLSITHLPQIAALAAHHFRVYKSEEDGIVASHIVPLSADERITEIAHMLSGEVMTNAALDNAKALLGIAN